MNNIMKLNDLIYAREKLVFWKIGVSPKKTNKNQNLDGN